MKVLIKSETLLSTREASDLILHSPQDSSLTVLNRPSEMAN